MKKSDYTVQIADADHRVDRCLMGMNTAIIAALHHFDHELVVPACHFVVLKVKISQ
jgi:hypothetical protein